MLLVLVALILAGATATAVPVLYWSMADWWHTLMGRALMAIFILQAVVIDLSIINSFTNRYAQDVNIAAAVLFARAAASVFMLFAIVRYQRMARVKGQDAATENAEED